MENRMKWLTYVVIVVAALGGSYVYLRAPASDDRTPPSGNVALASFTNARGQEWTIPTGDFEFSVSSDRSIYPSFLWGDISPLKVQPGDVQKMRIIVGDRVPVKSVVATIETDTKKFEVPLHLVRTEARASPETAVAEARYSVDESNRLVVNDEATIAKAVETGVIPSAHAQVDPAGEIMRYVFEGEWVVEDTHRETYHTIFTAENESGEKNTLVMAWSDPCLFFNGAIVYTDCAITGGPDGLDNASYSLGGYDVTLGDVNAVLAFSPGSSITIPAGSSIAVGSGKIQQTRLYHTDSDADRFILSVAYQTSGTYAASTFYGSDVDSTHRVPTAAVSSFIVQAPLEKAYSFVDELVRNVFAVGPCPGHPSCPPAAEVTWSTPTNVYAADGSAASASSPTDSSEYLITSGHGFSLPTSSATTTATILGVEVKVRARVSGGSSDLAVFAGVLSGSAVGSPVTVSATSFTDYYFGGLGYLWGGITASGVNSSNFGAQIQAYNASGGNTVYVDQVTVRVYYRMEPIVDADDAFASSCLSGAGLVNCAHTSAQCSSAAGTRIDVGGVSVCRFGASIPGGWVAYSNWSQTTSDFCTGGATNPFPPFASVPIVYAACDVSGCTTGSHSWANTARESCTYQIDPIGCAPLTCEANYTYRGGY